MTRERPTPRRVDRERAAPAVVSERLERRLAPAARPGRPVADRGAEHVVAVAKDRRRDDDVLTDDALDGIAAAVDLRLDVADQDRPAAGLCAQVALGVRLSQVVRLKRASGILLHPTSLPDGRLGEEAYRFVDWLEAAGQSWWQVLPLGPADAVGLAVQRRVGVRGLAGAARRAARACHRQTRSRSSSRGTRSGRATGRRSRGRRRARRPGPLRARMDCAARLRAQARRAHLRRRPDLRRAREAPSISRTRSSSATARSPARRPTSFSATGQHWGNPLYDWSAHRATGYRWWIERFRRTFELVDMTRLDHFRGFVSVLGDPGAAQDRAARPLAARSRRRALSRGAGALGELPLVAEDLGVDHPGRRPAARSSSASREWSCCSGRSAARRSNPHRLENHERAVRRLHVDARHRHRARLVRVAAAARSARATGLDPRAPALEPDRARACVALPRSSIIPAQDVLGLGSEAA